MNELVLITIYMFIVSLKMNNLKKKAILALSLGVFVTLALVAYEFNRPNLVNDQPSTQITSNKTGVITKEITDNRPIKVGVLHSLSGTMAISEKPVVDATLLAIGEINQHGGVLGRKILPIVLDGHSDWPTFAREADFLITKENVSAVFGGWTSASRKTMKPVFEEHNSLLFYPVQYEGLEDSSNIIYTGAAPNQQVIPAVDWSYENLGKTFFLVGSDYVFPRSANEIMKYRIKELGGEIVGEEYKKLGETDFKDVVNKIAKIHPKIILNTINGDSNLSFFKELRKQGVSSKLIPTMSFSIGEDEIQKIGSEVVVGDYAAWNYFQSVNTPENVAFVKEFKMKYGENAVISDPMEAAYISVNIFAISTQIAGSDDVNKIRNATAGVIFAAPEGIVGVDTLNHHLYKTIRIGKILPNGQFEIVSSSELPIRPIPYPTYKSKEQWEGFLNGLYEGWGKKWSNS